MIICQSLSLLELHRPVCLCDYKSEIALKKKRWQPKFLIANVKNLQAALFFTDSCWKGLISDTCEAGWSMSVCSWAPSPSAASVPPQRRARCARLFREPYLSRRLWMLIGLAVLRLSTQSSPLCHLTQSTQSAAEMRGRASVPTSLSAHFYVVSNHTHTNRHTHAHTKQCPTWIYI